MENIRQETIDFIKANEPAFSNESFEKYSTEVLLEIKRMLELNRKARCLSKKYAA